MISERPNEAAKGMLALKSEKPLNLKSMLHSGWRGDKIWPPNISRPWLWVSVVGALGAQVSNEGHSADTASDRPFKTIPRKPQAQAGTMFSKRIVAIPVRCNIVASSLHSGLIAIFSAASCAACAPPRKSGGVAQ